MQNQAEAIALYDEWLKALRSGNYDEAPRFADRLRVSQKQFSPMGVLADVGIGSWLEYTGGYYVLAVPNDGSYVSEIPSSLVARVGLVHPWGWLGPNQKYRSNSVAVLGYRGMPHSEIADVLEAEQRRLFKWAAAA